jgi:hypothetical protein
MLGFSASVEIMCATIEQYIFQHKGVRITCKPNLEDQRELFLLEYVYNYIIQNQGFHVEFS